jgi:site-specific DNA recombinase
MRVIGYARASTDKQKYTISSQIDQIKEFCDKNGHELVELIHEVRSGKDLRRDGIKSAIKMLTDKTADIICVSSIDRLTRNVNDFNEIIKTVGFDSIVSIKSITGTIREDVSLAEWEREEIGERTSTALQHMKAQGAILGPRRYGFSVSEKAIEGIAEELDVIARMKDLQSQGVSLAGIARSLNQDGIKTLRGASWTHVQVKASIDRLNAMMMDEAAVAQAEREAISARTKAALAQAKARGVKLGTDGQFLTDEGRRKGAARSAKAQRTTAVKAYDDLAETVRSMHEAGASLRAIANKLNEEGYRTRESAEFKAPTIQRILRRSI